MNKNIYYYSETTDLFAVSSGHPLKATNLTSAKCEARRKSIFCGTWIKIGTSVNSDGLLTSYIAYFSPNESRWHEVDCLLSFED